VGVVVVARANGSFVASGSANCCPTLYCCCGSGSERPKIERAKGKQNDGEVRENRGGKGVSERESELSKAGSVGMPCR
jgi:hypothetical protein